MPSQRCNIRARDTTSRCQAEVSKQPSDEHVAHCLGERVALQKTNYVARGSQSDHRDNTGGVQRQISAPSTWQSRIPRPALRAAAGVSREGLPAKTREAPSAAIDEALRAALAAVESVEDVRLRSSRVGGALRSVGIPEGESSGAPSPIRAASDDGESCLGERGRSLLGDVSRSGAGAARRSQSLAAARQSHKKSVGAAERTARFNRGLLEKLSELQDDLQH